MNTSNSTIKIKGKVIGYIVGLLGTLALLGVFIFIEICIGDKAATYKQKDFIVTIIRIVQFIATTASGLLLNELIQLFRGNKEIHRVIDLLKDCCEQLDVWIDSVNNKSIAKSMTSLMRLIDKQIKALEEISNKENKVEKSEDVLKMYTTLGKGKGVEVTSPKNKNRTNIK